MATATVDARAPAHYGNLQHTALSAFWFGSNFLWIPLTTVLIQNQIDSVVPKGSQNTAIGVALWSLIPPAMAATPVVETPADRHPSRLLRRTPLEVLRPLHALACA